MKNITRNCCLALLASLMTLPAIAQINGSGYYRIRNAQYDNHYLSIANDIMNFSNIINAAGGGWNLVLGFNTYSPYCMSCATAYLNNDIHTVTDPDCINPATVIYAKQRNYYPNDYNLIGQGTSLLTLTTGIRTGSAADITFPGYYMTIANSGNLYTASIEISAKVGSTSKSIGKRYFSDNDGIFAINEDSNASNAKWIIEPISQFNVAPTVSFNGKYYTTLVVPFQCELDPNSNVKKAYVIESVSNGIVQPVELTDGIIPAGTPVVLECDSNTPAECWLKITLDLIPRYTEPETDAVSVPGADKGTNYNGVNILKGTYYCNQDGTIQYNTTSGTNAGSFNGNNVTSATDPQKYVLGITESGKLGFIPASGNMPINKAWLESASEFPWELPVTVKLGDVNDDGVVSIKDVTCLIDYLLGGEPEPFNLDNADVSEDGAVTIKDVTALIDLLLSNPDE